MGFQAGRQGWRRHWRLSVVGLRRTLGAATPPPWRASRTSCSDEQGVRVVFSIPPYGNAICVPEITPGTDSGIGSFDTVGCHRVLFGPV